MMTPRYFVLAIPFTLIKWFILVYWAWEGSTAFALILFAFFYLANAMLPIPAKLTLPPIRARIARISLNDRGTGETLTDATNMWEMRGRRF
jgi:hypothetical protein